MKGLSPTAQELVEKCTGLITDFIRQTDEHVARINAKNDRINRKSLFGKRKVRGNDSVKEILLNNKKDFKRWLNQLNSLSELPASTASKILMGIMFQISYLRPGTFLEECEEIEAGGSQEPLAA